VLSKRLSIKNKRRYNIIGKFFSLQQTGFFAQSNKLYTMPTNIVSSIVDKAKGIPPQQSIDNIQAASCHSSPKKVTIIGDESTMT